MENKENKSGLSSAEQAWVESAIRDLEARKRGEEPSESYEERRKKERAEQETRYMEEMRKRNEEHERMMREAREKEEADEEKAEQVYHVHQQKPLVIKERLKRLKTLGCHQMGLNDPFIFGRDEEIKLIEKTLIQLKKPNVILVGGAGTGKTAIIEKFAHNILHNNCSDILHGHIVVEMTTSGMIAGTIYRGAFEEKIEKLLNALKGEKIILFIDEVHTVMGLGSSDGGNGKNGSVGLQDVLKPYLARGEIKVIGATTTDEYHFIAQDAAFDRRFRAVHVVEPTLAQTEEILTNALTPYVNHFGVNIHTALIHQIVIESEKIKGHNPDKSLTIMELAMSNAKYENRTAVTIEDINYGVENY